MSLSVPKPEAVEAYVDAALQFHGYDALGSKARAAVQQNFKVIAAVAASVLAQTLMPEDEMAPVFHADATGEVQP
jgi:hypothetical protein